MRKLPGQTSSTTDELIGKAQADATYRLISDSVRVIVVANYAAAPAGLPAGTVVISTSGT